MLSGILQMSNRESFLQMAASMKTTQMGKMKAFVKWKGFLMKVSDICF